MKFNGPTSTDFYKTGHVLQYPENTEEVYSNMTGRSNNYAKIHYPEDKFYIHVFLQYVIKELLIERWNKDFFGKNIDKICAKYDRRIKNSLGLQYVNSTRFRELHALGYLPIEIKSLPEGAKIPIGVPSFTFKNTLPQFFWLTNFLETSLSCMLWKASTSATTAYQYYKLLIEFAEKTGASKDFVPFQGHDFSFRGMCNIQDAAASGFGHLLSFVGTDSIPAIDLAEDYYGANSDKEMIGVSVPATEHSVMCMGGEDDEVATFKRLITETYPKGIISIVSDTWDFWKVITEYLDILKPQILNRNGKVVIRPDSGDPVKIVVGDPDTKKGSPEYKGAVQCLWDVFGGTRNNKGYKELDSHIGIIYGDSISLERAYDILDGLEKKEFASSNIVFGIGSYTYTYVTRDNHGFAIKSTSGKVNGIRKEIFKDPKTDDGIKKSAKGLLRIEYENGKYILYDQQTEEHEKLGLLKTVFKDGKLVYETTLKEIRERLKIQEI